MRNRFDVRDADLETLKADDLTPVTIVSADGHVCPPPREYKNYLEAKYHDAFAGYMEDVATIHKITGVIGYPILEEELEIRDSRGAISAAGEAGFFDPVWRLRQVEAEGIAAEFLHPFGAVGFTPFFDLHNSPRPAELRAAGARAHNRWLEEFCSEAPGRLLGVAPIYPWPDWDSAVADIKRAREAGFYAIYPPTTAGVDLPPMSDPWWDPMWSACQEYGVAVHIHASFGNPQGEAVALVTEAAKRSGDEADSVQNQVFATIAESHGERRPLWQLMWGGVFDRFPALKIVFVEVHGDWVPPTLNYLDRVHAAEPGPMKLTPSEYWQRHCAVGGSLMRYGDVAARHELGLNKLMFGTDYPHFEGSWPNTKDWIRATMDSIPVEEAKAILGQNAINFYGLDRNLLERTAKRVGPLPADILGGGHTVDPHLIRNFEERSGIHKPVFVDQEGMSRIFENDRTLALVSTGSAEGLTS